MKNKTIRVMTKRPGRIWRIQHIDNTLEALQQFVGGYIETVTVMNNVVIICNEEGAIQWLPFNVNLLGYNFLGPVILAGVKGEEFADLPEHIIDSWKLVIGEEML